MANDPREIEEPARQAREAVEHGQQQAGMMALHHLIKHAPDSFAVWFELGNAHRSLGQYLHAEAAYRESLRIDPHNHAARLRLAGEIIKRYGSTEARKIVRAVISENPQSADAWTVMGTIQLSRGQPGDAIFAFQRALAIQSNPVMGAMLLVARQYSETSTPEKLLQAHRDWDRNHALPLLPGSPPSRPAGDRPRLGFVASDFGTGPTGLLSLHAFERLKDKGATVICYSGGTAEDEYTARFRAASSEWRVTIGQSDEELAASIRRDEIDVLFDLNGPGGVRLLTFARKPAPVQITWLGYVGTTGMQAMDFLLADRFHVREDEDGHYSESILRMPHSYICFSPTDGDPPVAPLPALSTDPFTFGCFNNPAKFSPSIIGAWSVILERTPGSRLLLKYGGLSDVGLQEEILNRFATHGIGADRLLMEGHSPRSALLARYGDVDLALDTQPYSGGLTTCEALWMGVPVVTFPGKTFAGRHATSHLMNAGYSQFVAPDLAGYIELAVEWAGKPNELAELRSGMREQVRRSPLCDAERYADDFLSMIAAATHRA